MVKLASLATALALATACSTLSTLHGARTLDPHESQVGFALSVQHGASPLGNVLALPQVEVAARYGVKPDVDVGFRVYLLGVGADVRYRFFSSEKLDLATAPGIDTFWIPGAGGAAGQGSAELRAPVLAEVQLGRAFSIGGGPALLLRDQWNSVTAGDVHGLQSRVDVYAGGGARVELHGKRVALGVSSDVYGQPSRSSGAAWSIGLDLSFRHPKHHKPPKG